MITFHAPHIAHSHMLVACPARAKYKFGYGSAGATMCITTQPIPPPVDAEVRDDDRMPVAGVVSDVGGRGANACDARMRVSRVASHVASIVSRAFIGDQLRRTRRISLRCTHVASDSRCLVAVDGGAD